MIKLGASGFIHKSSGFSVIKDAIRTVYNGKKYFCAYTISLLYNTIDKGSDNLSNLTAREKEIIKYIANGNTSKEIGDLLFISTKTIEAHRNRIFHKMNVRNAVELMQLVNNKLNNNLDFLDI